jgi:hypothetical protein
MKDKKYIHTENVHNLHAPKFLIEELLKHFLPQKVIDI